jgi:hypothetical protein
MDHVTVQTDDSAFLQSIIEGVPLPQEVELTGAWRCKHCGCVEELSGSGWTQFRHEIMEWLRSQGLLCVAGACSVRAE